MAFSMEQDPLYCDVIVQRFETFTGQKTKRLKSPPNQQRVRGHRSLRCS
jgi:hypothetical protein